MRMTLLGVALALAAATMAAAAGEWRVSIEGQKTGWLAGDPQLQGEAHPATPVLGFTLEVVTPRDPQSGLPTGQRQHKPIMFQVPWGPVMAQLQQCLSTNENLKTVILEYRKPNVTAQTGVGSEELTEVITLTNANISEIKHHTVFRGSGAVRSRSAEVADVFVTYQKIQIENKKGGTTTEDDWEARV